MGRSTVLKCLIILHLLEGIVMAGVFSRNMKFTNIATHYNTSYYSNFTAWINNDSLNMDMRIRRPVVYGFLSQMDMQIKLKGNQQYQSLFSYAYDVCKMMNEHLGVGLLRLWFRNAIKYGNWIEHCPVPAGHYYIHNFRLEPGSIPSYLRPGDYRMIMYSHYGKRQTKRERMVSELIWDFQLY